MLLADTMTVNILKRELDRAHKSKNLKQATAIMSTALTTVTVRYAKCEKGDECFGHPVLDRAAGVKNLWPGRGGRALEKFEGPLYDISQFPVFTAAFRSDLIRLGRCPGAGSFLEVDCGSIKDWAEESTMLTDAMILLERYSGRLDLIASGIMDHWFMHRGLPPQIYAQFAPIRFKPYATDMVEDLRDEPERYDRMLDSFHLNLSPRNRRILDESEKEAPGAPARLRLRRQNADYGTPQPTGWITKRINRTSSSHTRTSTAAILQTPNSRREDEGEDEEVARALFCSEKVFGEGSGAGAGAGAGDGPAPVPEKRKVSRRRSELEMLQQRGGKLYGAPKDTKRNARTFKPIVPNMRIRNRRSYSCPVAGGVKPDLELPSPPKRERSPIRRSAEPTSPEYVPDSEEDTESVWSLDEDQSIEHMKNLSAMMRSPSRPAWSRDALQQEFLSLREHMKKFSLSDEVKRVIPQSPAKAMKRTITVREELNERGVKKRRIQTIVECGHCEDGMLANGDVCDYCSCSICGAIKWRYEDTCCFCT